MSAATVAARLKAFGVPVLHVYGRDEIVLTRTVAVLVAPRRFQVLGIEKRGAVHHYYSVHTRIKDLLPDLCIALRRPKGAFTATAKGQAS